MTEPRVREATTDDADRVHALAGELAGTVGDSPPSRQVVGRQLRQLLEEPRAAVLVAEDREGVVIGAVSLWIKPDLAHGDVAVEVPMLVVSEDRRREGVGRLLIEEVRRLAAENDAGVIELVATIAKPPGARVLQLPRFCRDGQRDPRVRRRRPQPTRRRRRLIAKRSGRYKPRHEPCDAWRD